MIIAKCLLYLIIVTVSITPQWENLSLISLNNMITHALQRNTYVCNFKYETAFSVKDCNNELLYGRALFYETCMTDG